VATTESQIKDLNKRLEKQFSVIPSKKSMTMLGNFAVIGMQKRVRLGFGSTKELGPKKSLKSLRDHSPAYKAYRKRYQSDLDSTTSARKQNLTFTGQLVRDIQLLKATKNNFKIGHSTSARNGDNFSNRKLSKWVQVAGRTYMDITNLEYKRLLRFYQNTIIKPALSKI